MTDDGWAVVAALDAIPDGKPVQVEAFGTRVLVLRSGDELFAVGDRCTHQGAPLHRGVAKGLGSDPTITCPAHGSVFSLADGRVRRGPAGQPIQAFDARVNGAVFEIRPRA